MRKLVIAVVGLLAFSTTYAQTADEFKAEQGPKKDSIAAIQGRVDALQAKIDALPGWKIGAFGTVGVNLSTFDNFFSKGIPNSSAGNIGFTVNAFANLKEEKFFWRNSANLNLQWVKIDDRDDDTDDDSFRQAADVFNISSLYGFNLSKNFAVSALAEYRTTILSNFNDPGYLDFGIGGTWTPIPDLVVVIHPLNYNFVFSDEDAIFDSSLGAKIVVDYTKKFGDLNFKTNFTTFQSYSSSDLSNWTWINSVGYTIFGAVGVGFEFGLRGNPQETLNYEINTLGNAGATFDNIEDRTQTYYLIGLNYGF